MFQRVKYLIYTRPIILFAYFFIRAYAFTFRLKLVNENRWKEMLGKGRPILLCTWHQQFFSVIRHFKTYADYNPALMISQSRDGDLIADVASRSGWHSARGSSSKGGKKALDEMIEHLTTRGMGAHILDGPQGPIGKIKAGVIRMTHASRAIVIPFYVEAENAWFFNSWDYFMLPKPFSKVTIRFGEPLDFISPDNPLSFDDQIKKMEQVMLPGLYQKPTQP